MKFIICDSTHFYELHPFIKEYEDALSKLNYQVVNKAEVAEEFDLKQNYRLNDAFDYHTNQGCMVDIDDLNSLIEFSHMINKNEKDEINKEKLFIDMESRLIVLTSYYPDN
ncbi:hypothetical protein [uncultured Lactobacillus sp.]|uniref:hypothetical protein n=1 Tax=uncultured Lactobacillus sp. TaxID=153152 RepID=UPI00258CBD37|nr:hypothetical protein [uncultured Lactobacillus sp.]